MVEGVALCRDCRHVCPQASLLPSIPPFTPALRADRGSFRTLLCEAKASVVANRATISPGPNKNLHCVPNKKHFASLHLTKKAQP